MAVKFLTDDWAKALAEACNADAKFKKAIKGQQAVLQINVAGSPEAPGFTMTYGDGQVQVTTGTTDNPDINLNLEYPTMIELSKGTVNGPQAMAGGRMTAVGNMEKMFSLGKAMDMLPSIESNLGIEY